MIRIIKGCSTRSFRKGMKALSLLLAAALLAACGSTRAAEPCTLRVGVAVYLQSDTFISTLVKEL